MNKTTLYTSAVLLALATVVAIARDYPDGGGTATPGVVLVCSTGTTQAGSGPCGTAGSPISVTGGGTPVAPTVTPAVASSVVLKASPGTLYGLSATLGATAGYVMVFDATSAPADGAVTPKYCWAVPANGSLAMGWPTAAAFATGIVAVFSSTGCFTKTASATAFLTGQAS